MVLVYFNIPNNTFIIYIVSTPWSYYFLDNLTLVNRLPDFSSDLLDKMKSISSPGSPRPRLPRGGPGFPWQEAVAAQEHIKRLEKKVGPSDGDPSAMASTMNNSKRDHQIFKNNNPDHGQGNGLPMIMPTWNP